MTQEDVCINAVKGVCSKSVGIESMDEVIRLFGVFDENLKIIEAETGAKEFHTSARSVVYSQMAYRKEEVPMGSSAVTSEFETVQTDREKVKQFV